MTWVKTEAMERRHPKLQSVSIAAYGFHHAARGWSLENRTDGYIPRAALGRIYHFVTERKALLFVKTLERANDPARPGSAPLWEPDEDGWWIHDFLEYNDSKKEIEGKQQDARQRQRNRRHRQAYGDAHDCQKAGCHTEAPGRVTRGVTQRSRVTPNGVTQGVTQESQDSFGQPFRTVPYRTDPDRGHTAVSPSDTAAGGAPPAPPLVAVAGDSEYSPETDEPIDPKSEEIKQRLRAENPGWSEQQVARATVAERLAGVKSVDP
jgi:hypothetical protein